MKTNIMKTNAKLLSLFQPNRRTCGSVAVQANLVVAPTVVANVDISNLDASDPALPLSTDSNTDNEVKSGRLSPLSGYLDYDKPTGQKQVEESRTRSKGTRGTSDGIFRLPAKAFTVAAAITIALPLSLSAAVSRTVEFKNQDGTDLLPFRADDLHIETTHPSTITSRGIFGGDRESEDRKIHNLWGPPVGEMVDRDESVTVQFSVESGKDATIVSWWWTKGGTVSQNGSAGDKHTDGGGRQLSFVGPAARGDGHVLVSIGGLTNIFRTVAGESPSQTMASFSSFLNQFEVAGFDLIYSFQRLDGSVGFVGNLLGDFTAELRAHVLSQDSGLSLTLQALANHLADFRIDQSFDPSGTVSYEAQVAPGSRFWPSAQAAQTLIVGTIGTFAGVEALIGRRSGEIGTLDLSIQPATVGNPSLAVDFAPLATASVPASAIGTNFGWVFFDLSPFQLSFASGTELAVVLSSSQPGSAFTWAGGNDNRYGHGGAYVSPGVVAFPPFLSEVPDHDLAFRIYVAGAATVEAPRIDTHTLSVSRIDATMHMRVPTQAGVTYQVQSTSSLTPQANWIGGVVFDGTGDFVHITLPYFPDENLFFRLLAGGLTHNGEVQCGKEESLRRNLTRGSICLDVQVTSQCSDPPQGQETTLELFANNKTTAWAVPPGDDGVLTIEIPSGGVLSLKCASGARGKCEWTSTLVPCPPPPDGDGE